MELDIKVIILHLYYFFVIQFYKYLKKWLKRKNKVPRALDLVRNPLLSKDNSLFVIVRKYIIVIQPCISTQRRSMTKISAWNAWKTQSINGREMSKTYTSNLFKKIQIKSFQTKIKKTRRNKFHSLPKETQKSKQRDWYLNILTIYVKFYKGEYKGHLISSKFISKNWKISKLFRHL